MLAAALSFSLLGCTPGQDVEPADTAPAEQDTQDAPETPETLTAEAEDTKPADNTPGQSLEKASGLPSGFSSQEEYKKINLFLSNFSEALFCVYASNGYEFDAYDHLGTLAHFA
ncbi:MAG: hypothetical protein LBB42_00145, partial [Coriobacteriales bacterium]|nr:hypothetical protein [Coriobacteriales bacterium]